MIEPKVINYPFVSKKELKRQQMFAKNLLNSLIKPCSEFFVID